MIYDFGVQEPYKSFLLNGKKTVEGRLNKGKFKNLEIGDVLEFDTGERFKVLGKREYVSFFKMMESEGVEKVLPDYADIQKGVEEVYYKFYSPKLEKEYGVVAVEVGLL